jgi:hypothetical protein
MSRLSTESGRMNVETAKSPAWKFSVTTTQKNNYSDQRFTLLRILQQFLID